PIDDRQTLGGEAELLSARHRGDTLEVPDADQSRRLARLRRPGQIISTERLGSRRARLGRGTGVLADSEADRLVKFSRWQLGEIYQPPCQVLLPDRQPADPPVESVDSRSGLQRHCVCLDSRWTRPARKGRSDAACGARYRQG